MENPAQLLPPLPHVKLSFFINTPIMFGILLAFFVIYSLASSVLVYHWSAYGMRSQGIIFAESIFIFVSIVLFVMAGVSIIYF